MANPTIRVKRSSIEGKVPAVDQIERGEFAINSFDGKVFILKDQSSVGVATTTTTVNPWTEPDGVGAGLTYAGQVSATSFVGDGSGLTNVGVSSNSEEYFTATQGQTAFSASQTLPTYIQVFVNGVKIRTTDYGTSGTTVTLNSGCNVGDDVDIVMFGV